MSRRSKKKRRNRTQKKRSEVRQSGNHSRNSGERQAINQSDNSSPAPPSSNESLRVDVEHSNASSAANASDRRAEGDKPDPGAKDEKKELKDLPVIHGRKWYLTMGALVTAAGALVGGTYGFVKFVEIAPINRELKDKGSSLEQTTQRLQAAITDKNELNDRLTSVSTEAELPTIVRPEDGATVFGKNIVLSWQFKKQPDEDDGQYYIELYNANKKLSKEYNVPAGVRVNFELTEPKGTFFWRVRQGYFDDRNHPVPQSRWSRWSRFAAYPSVMSRIKETGVLRVTTKPVAEDDKFVFRDKTGNYSGFEIELVRWVARKLSAKLGVPVKVQFIQRRWAHKKSLLKVVNDGDVDLAVRSITKTLARELTYGSMRFSDGYIDNHQIFVQMEPNGEFPQALKDQVVGVKKGSTNEKAAIYLQPKFGFRVDASFENYPDLRKALRDRKIRYALVDELLISRFIREREVEQFGQRLDAPLANFNEEKMGRETEEYGMAVHVPGKDDELLKLVNEFLRSDDGKNTVANLRKMYVD